MALIWSGMGEVAIQLGESAIWIGKLAIEKGAPRENWRWLPSG